MKRALACLLFLGALFAGPACYAEEKGAWPGVDEAVVEKFAAAAGRPSRAPFINTDQGDLLLFVFLLAGTAGGFVAGYYFRTLFPPRPKERQPRVGNAKQE